MSEVPKGPGYRVGITFNLKRKRENELEDEQAEYDSIHTIEAIGKAIRNAGCETIFLEAEEDLPRKLQNTRPDIVFNVAEGKGGRGREAQVPAILNLYSIPFTGSDRDHVMHCTLEKGLRKNREVPQNKDTSVFCLERNLSDIPPQSSFPVIVKTKRRRLQQGLCWNNAGARQKRTENPSLGKMGQISSAHSGGRIHSTVASLPLESSEMEPTSIFSARWKFLISKEGNPDAAKSIAFMSKLISKNM